MHRNTIFHQYILGKRKYPWIVMQFTQLVWHKTYNICTFENHTHTVCIVLALSMKIVVAIQTRNLHYYRVIFSTPGYCWAYTINAYHRMLAFQLQPSETSPPRSPLLQDDPWWSFLIRTRHYNRQKRHHQGHHSCTTIFGNHSWSAQNIYQLVSKFCISQYSEAGTVRLIKFNIYVFCHYMSKLTWL